ncbi:MAG: hypothetical protein IPO30_19570 [Hyphomonadaceae bacterium]|nr:hypothetical protein [Hyphomonadaceae bacterium]
MFKIASRRGRYVLLGGQEMRVSEDGHHGRTGFMHRDLPHTIASCQISFSGCCPGMRDIAFAFDLRQ